MGQQAIGWGITSTCYKSNTYSTEAPHREIGSIKWENGCRAPTTVPGPWRVAYKFLWWWLQWLFLLNMVVKSCNSQRLLEFTSQFHNAAACSEATSFTGPWITAVKKIWSPSHGAHILCGTARHQSKCWFPALPHFPSLDVLDLSLWYQGKRKTINAHTFITNQTKYKLQHHLYKILYHIHAL